MMPSSNGTLHSCAKPMAAGTPLTAHALASDRERAFQAGCDDYETKPIELTGLITKIEAHLKKGRAVITDID